MPRGAIIGRRGWEPEHWGSAKLPGCGSGDLRNVATVARPRATLLSARPPEGSEASHGQVRAVGEKGGRWGMSGWLAQLH